MNELNYFKKVKFVGSFLEAPTRLALPQFAFCGRSNVGKSSLINALLEQKVARVSKTPGKTITINTYLIDEKFYVVDLPGYGYAQRSKTIINSWKKSIERYLKNANMLRTIFLLIDSRILLIENDIIFLEWLNYYQLKTVIVLTKIDKANQSQLSFIKRNLSNLKLQYVPTSALRQKGLDRLAQIMLQACV